MDRFSRLARREEPSATPVLQALQQNKMEEPQTEHDNQSSDHSSDHSSDGK